MTRDELVRLGSSLAESLERQQQTLSAGLVRQLVRQVAAPDTDDGTCACGCREQLVQPRRGRRRRWVDESHRRRARR